MINCMKVENKLNLKKMTATRSSNWIDWRTLVFNSKSRRSRCAYGSSRLQYYFSRLLLRLRAPARATQFPRDHWADVVQPPQRSRRCRWAAFLHWRGCQCCLERNHCLRLRRERHRGDRYFESGQPAVAFPICRLRPGWQPIDGCFQVGQSLVVPVNTQSGFVYDVSDSRNIKSQARFTPAFPFSGSVSFLGNIGWFTTDSFNYNTSSNAISQQSGNFFSVDFTDPTLPVTAGNLAADSSQPASSNASPRFASMTNGGDTAYVLSTTSTGGDSNGGQGRLPDRQYRQSRRSDGAEPDYRSSGDDPD